MTSTVTFKTPSIENGATIDDSTSPRAVVVVGGGAGDTADTKEKQKIGHRRIDRLGEVSYKRVPTNALMGAIQLGITHSLSSLDGPCKKERDLLLQDFDYIDHVAFPPEGSQTTPVHQFGDFRFKAYAPFAFRYFRDIFEIKADDFLRSICDQPLKELTNAGASGSIFYVSSDDQFIIKTVQHKEADFLQKLLPGYYMNLNQNARTLLPKFFGLFCYQSLGKNIRLLVMNNLLPQTITMHEKYDIKGSTYKRAASKSERAKSTPTLKDLDFSKEHADGIFLEAATYDALMKTISRDCLVLESFKIMDYSMLIGIHNIDLAARIEDQQHASADANDSNVDECAIASTSHQSSSSSSKPPPSARRVLRHKSLFSAWESIQTDALPIDLGEGYPDGGVPARNSKGERLLLFLGIIDILQNYRLFKKLEHAWKSVLHDGNSISVHRPGYYALRFQDAMKNNVFRKIPSPLKHSPSRKRQMRKSANERGDDRASRFDAAGNEIAISTLTPRPDASSAGGDIVGGALRESMRRSTDSRPPIGYNRQDTLVEGETTQESRREKKPERLFASSPPPPENTVTHL